MLHQTLTPSTDNYMDALMLLSICQVCGDYVLVLFANDKILSFDLPSSKGVHRRDLLQETAFGAATVLVDDAGMELMAAWHGFETPSKNHLVSTRSCLGRADTLK